MKITFLTSHFPELSEQFIINQVLGLVEAGVDVSVISFHNSNKTYINPEFEKFNLSSITKCLSIPKNYFQRLIKVFPKVLRLLFLSPIKLFVALNIYRYNRAVLSLKTIYVLDALRGIELPILHCHFGPNGIVGAFLKDVGIAKKIVVTFHGADINSYPVRYGKNVYKHLFKVEDRITVNTNFTGNKVIKYGADCKNIHILPVGLKCEYYPYLKKHFDFSGSPVILTVARLTEKKGIKYAIESMKHIVKRYPKAMYHIVGSGSKENELRNLISLHGLNSNVVLHGYCNRSVIFDLYRIASVFLLPSVTASNGDMEGQGLVLQEAQAVGLPVVSTLHNGIPDGVLDGKTGFLLPEKNSSLICEKIIYLTLNSEKARLMGFAGRKFVLAKYDIPILTKKILDVYKLVKIKTIV